MRSFCWWEVDDQNKWVYAAEMLYRVTGSLIGPEFRTSEGNTKKHKTSTTFFLVTLRLPPAYPPHSLFAFAYWISRIGWRYIRRDNRKANTNKTKTLFQGHSPPPASLPQSSCFIFFFLVFQDRGGVKLNLNTSFFFFSGSEGNACLETCFLLV